MTEKPEAPASPEPLSRRVGQAIVRFQIMLGMALALFLGLELWAKRQMRYATDWERPDESFWLECDSYRDADWLPAYVEENRRVDVRWTPYIYWQHIPVTGRHINVDARGLRRTVSAATPSATGRVVNISVFGGSTTWGYGVRDAHTLPSQLQRALRARGVNARVENHGAGAFVSTQEMIKFLLLHREDHRPDLAVFLDGMNDVCSAWLNGKAGLPQNEANRIREFNLSGRTGLILKYAVSGGARGWNILRWLRRRLAPAAPPPSVDVDRLSGDTWQRYTNNVHLTRTVAQAAGVRTAFFWQPTPYTKRTVTAFEERLRSMAAPDLRALFAATYERARGEAAAANGLGLHDLSDVFDRVADPRFIDFFHLSEIGNAELADAMAERLLPLLTAP